MKRITIFAAVVVTALGWAGSASAGLPDGLGPWADYVVAYNQGCAFIPPDMTTCVAPPPSRTDPQAAVGVAESPAGPNQNIPVGTFYSVGFTDASKGTAFITLGFDNTFCNAAGADLAVDVFEITQEPYPPESVNVYVSQDNVNYVFAGKVTKDGTVGLPAAIPYANFVKLVDATNRADFVNTPIIADGYDVDGVRALHSLADCPGVLPGKLEICKASTNGMAGRLFQYSIDGGAPISVRGGRCTGPITVFAGAVRIEELQSNPPTEVTNVTVRPSGRLLIKDLPNRTAIVLVVAGTTAANETMVTFTNQPAGGTFGDLKICKVSESPQYWGRLFSFSINGGALVSTEANPAFEDPSTWSCRIVGSFPVGSRVPVREALQPGSEIAWFDSSPVTALGDFDTNTGTATVTIAAPATTLFVDNEPIPPPQSGTLEICKDPAYVPGANGLVADPALLGPFTFTVAAPDGSSFDTVVGVGQCSATFTVAAGVVRVTEHAVANHTLVDDYTIPADRFVEDNLINGTIDVEVPVSSNPNDETQVHFVNQRNRGQLKVCKSLGAGSGALDTMAFTFTASDLDNARVPSVTMPINASILGTQCVVFGDFPVGDRVNVTEANPGPNIDVTGGGTTTIASGVNEVDFTNTATGLLEICKAKVTDVNTQPTFTFRVDGTLLSIRAGTCTNPALKVSVGSHTVTEIAQQYYELDPYAPGNGIVVSPAGNEASRDLAARTVTVNVGFAGPNGDETAVTFANRVKQAFVKVCKQLAPGSVDALDGKSFPFTLYIQTGGTHAYPQFASPISFSITASRDGGVCYDPIFGPFPVLQRNGEKTIAGIQEGAVPGSVVDTITVAPTNGMCVNGSGTPNGNNSPVCVGTTGIDTGQRIADWFLSPNDVNIVTYTNKSG
jgi:hypothetical protein